MRRRLSFATVTVLHALARGCQYGFDIIDDTGLPSGTVYPALSRLERDGYVRSGWENVEIARAEKRPARRYYTVLAPGVRALDAALRHYRALKPLRIAPARTRG